MSLGVCRLPLFLKSSRTLYCIFDDQWTTRLWCVWELAVYLKLRKNPNVVFLSISQRTVEIFIVLIMFASYCIESGIVYIHAGCNCKAMLLTYYTFWSFIVVDICFFILGQRYLRDQATLRRTIATYDVREAQLSDAKDRDMLLKKNLKNISGT